MPQASARRPALALHHRKSIGKLTDKQLSGLRRAYNAVLPIQDERGYNHHAGIHGLPLPIYPSTSSATGDASATSGIVTFQRNPEVPSTGGRRTRSRRKRER